jgi:glycine cleavage system H lipoate-binding protein
MNSEANETKGRLEVVPSALRSQTTEVFGFQVPMENYYLHRGHTWALIEEDNKVRVGMDDFSQKILGPADGLELPDLGKVYYQDHVCMALTREGHKAKVLIPVDGAIEKVNARVLQQPSLVHDDPYGEGWLFMVNATNLGRNMENLLYGMTSVAFIDAESHKLLSLMESTVGATLPDGGAIIDDVYGHFPKIGWRSLVQEFLLKDLTKTWKKRY